MRSNVWGGKSNEKEFFAVHSGPNLFRTRTEPFVDWIDVRFGVQRIFPNQTPGQVRGSDF
jgi:hypothetical protein